ncbi:MAG TPA: hypothetical protein VFC19_21080, partial [Candidatus Limnocylindrales bacterium]|nr:hypothetical protein [Candidatus Limnocylindrales bacterium]
MPTLALERSADRPGWRSPSANRQSGAATVDGRRRAGGSGASPAESSATNTAISSGLTYGPSGWAHAEGMIRNEAQVRDQLPDTRIPNLLDPLCGKGIRP